MVKELNFEVYNDRSNECAVLEEKDIIHDLKDTLKELDRPYLCANEIGKSKRLFVLKFDGDKLITFANPVYQVREDMSLIREKDFNTNIEYIIPRYKNVTICYQNEAGEVTATKFNEESSPLICQIMDCLDGIHPSDYGLEVIPEFDEATDDERKEVLKQYICSLQDLDLVLNEELEKDDETNKVWKDFKFQRAVANKEVELYNETPQLNRKQRRLMDKLAGKFKKKGKTHALS